MDILSYKLGQNSIEPDKPDQDKTANPSTQTQVIRADSGYELASVTINPVTSSIDENIQPENIANGVSILGVTGTLSGGAEPNIFVQTTEPETKDGIWVQTDKEYDTVVIDEDVFAEGEFDSSSGLPDCPVVSGKMFNCGFHTPEAYYLIAGSSATDGSYKYKYTYATKQWSTFKMNADSVRALCKGENSDYAILIKTTGYFVTYKYSTETTSSNISTYNYTKVTGTTIGNIAYLFGHNTNNYERGAKRDFVNNKSTDLPNPTFRVNGDAFQYGDYIYLFGCSPSNAVTPSNLVYRYNINGNSYTQLANSPVNLSNDNSGINNTFSSPIRIDNYVYLAPSKDVNAIYRFNLTTETFEKFADLPFNYIKRAGLGYYDGKLYVFCPIYKEASESSEVNSMVIMTISMTSKSYNNNSLVINQYNLYTKSNITQMYPNDFTGKLKTPINNVYLYNNNTLYSNLPTYIGDGTSWNKIKG